MKMYQFARFGRGLAPGNQEKCISALRKWHHNATNLHCDESNQETIRIAMEEYAAAWSSRFSKKQKTIHTSFSTSASLFSSRKDKGKARSVVEAVGSWLNMRLEGGDIPANGKYYTVLGTSVNVNRPELESVEDPDDHYRPKVGNLIAGTTDPSCCYNVQELVLLWALSCAPYNFAWEVQTTSPPDYTPAFDLAWVLPRLWLELPEVTGSTNDIAVTARVCCVPEDGNKSRIVTTDPDMITILLHCARDVLYSVVDKDPYMTAHDHSTIWHFGRQLGRKEKTVDRLLSVDKTCFSDTFDLPLARAIYDGVARGHQDPNARRVLLALRSLATGSRRYMVPDYSNGKTMISTTAARLWFQAGIQEGFFLISPAKNVAILPMGSPITYSVNCIWSRFEHDAACHPRGIGPFLAKPKPTYGEPCRIQGDDTVCRSSKRKANRYRTVCKLTGTQIGDGSQHESRRLAVFCEEALFRPDPSGKWEHEDTLKTRVLNATNCRKDPTLPVGVTDPLLTRGNAVSGQIRYATAEMRSQAIYVLEKTLNRLKTSGKDHFREFFTPTYLGGLGYPSRRSDARIWRKWVPKNVKRIVSALVSPDMTEQTVLNPNTLNSLSYFNKKGAENRRDVFTLLQDVPRRRDSLQTIQELTDAGENWLKRQEPHMNLGFVVQNDLVQEFAKQRNSQPDEFGNEPTSLNYRGRRYILTELKKVTKFRPLGDVLKTLERDESLRALISSLDSCKPYFGYKNYKRMYKDRIHSATELLGERAERTPIIRSVHDFDQLDLRLKQSHGNMWVHVEHPEVELLLGRAGMIKLGETG